MKLVKYIGIGLSIVVSLLVVIGYILPGVYGMNRSIIVNAPVEDVFPLVNNLKNWEDWYPWQAGVPGLRVVYSIKIEGEGASSHWTSLEFGGGSILITESIPNELVRADIIFQEESKAIGIWKFIPMDTNKTKILWEFKGDAEYNIIGRYFGLFIDSSLGPYFELGLQKLKFIAETKKK